MPGVPRSPPLASGHLRHPGARSLPLAESCLLFPWLILFAHAKPSLLSLPRPLQHPPAAPLVPKLASRTPAVAPAHGWGGRSSLCPRFGGGWMGPARAGRSEPRLTPRTGPVGAATVPCVRWQRRRGEIRRIWQRRARGQTCFFLPLKKRKRKGTFNLRIIRQLRAAWPGVPGSAGGSPVRTGLCLGEAKPTRGMCRASQDGAGG